ncbi:MAG: hypothetical protein HYZ50_04340 [Deltaproteobacteria bacterium]|nr:hypothetical protein [Deltaproteobacteria bacterium]
MAKALTLFISIVAGLTLEVRSGWPQMGVSLGDIANLGNFGLGTGLMGGGETIPGAILVKIQGEVQCTNCTLEEMGVEQTPGDLHQLSYEKTHIVVKVTKAEPDIAWELVGRHKLFLRVGENPAQLKRLLDEAAPGKQIDVTAGVTPSQGDLIPLIVKVK